MKQDAGATRLDTEEERWRKLEAQMEVLESGSPENRPRERTPPLSNFSQALPAKVLARKGFAREVFAR